MDFPSNSKNPTAKSKPQKPDAPEKVVEKVVTSPVITRKLPLGKRFKNMITGVEFRGATQYVFMDVLVPAVKNMVVDAVDVGVKRVVYGEGHRSMPRTLSQGSKTTYNQPVRRQSTMLPGQPPYSPPSRQSRISNEVILETRDEAELVLSTLVDIIDTYGFASVADFHTIIDIPSTYVDNNWGWSVLHHVNIRQVREGFLLEMPSTEPLS